VFYLSKFELVVGAHCRLVFEINKSATFLWQSSRLDGE
jgi:hypothetical protein